MKILKNIGLFALSLLASFASADYFYIKIYGLFFGTTSGFFGTGGIGGVLIGLVIAYILFTSLLFTAFGDKKKYWWVGVLLLPVAWFIIKFDLTHWYFYLALAVAGWLVGWLISKLLVVFRGS